MIQPKIPPRDLQRFFWDAEESYPYEACGVWAQKTGYVKMPNMSTTPETSFLIPSDQLTWFYNKGLAAILHSHNLQIKPGGLMIGAEDQKAHKRNGVMTVIAGVSFGKVVRHCIIPKCKMRCNCLEL